MRMMRRRLVLKEVEKYLSEMTDEERVRLAQLAMLGEAGR